MSVGSSRWLNHTNGITIGPYAGRLLAQLTLGQTPEMDLTPYAPFREFATTDEGALIR